MELELSDGTIQISRETISYFIILQQAIEDDPKIGKLSFESISVETFTKLVKWLHHEEVIIDDDIINAMIFFGMVEPHKTRFHTEIAEYLLAEPRLLPDIIYTTLIKTDPGRLFLFADKYFSNEEKETLKTYMTQPENLGEDNEYNGKIIVYNYFKRKIIDDFLALNPNAWVYIYYDLFSLN